MLRKKREADTTPVLNSKEAQAHAEARARRVGEAVQSMKRFFDGKPYYRPYPDPKGNPCATIPPEVLICPTNIDIVMDTQDINLAMEIVEEEIKAAREARRPLAKSGHIGWKEEVELNKWMFGEFRRLEIPYEFQAGMCLLYLWLCEGVEYI